MSKIVILILTAAAFFYALGLVLSGRKLPDPARARGLRRRFILATLLFAGLLGFACEKEKEDSVEIMCYAQIPHDPNSMVISKLTHHEVIMSLKAVWRTLDKERGEEFRAKLEAAAGRGAIRRKTADMLATAFQEIAYHKYRTRSEEGKMITCYEPIPFNYNSLQTNRALALKQLELLRKARQEGQIDDATIKKAQAVLARELEMMYQVVESGASGDAYENPDLDRQYKDNNLAPSDAALQAATMIVEMEGGTAPGVVE